MRGIFAAEKEKQKRKKKIQRTVYLVGAGPGAGVTHTGILLAEYLEERRGARTLFLEANRHRDIRCIRRELLSADYVSIEEERLRNLKLESYDYIVADLGTNLSFQQSERNKGEIKGILIGSGAPWRTERFCQMAEGIRKEYPQIAWRGLISMGNRRESFYLSEKLKLPVGFLGYQPLYESLSAESEEMFLSLIQGGEG